MAMLDKIFQLLLIPNHIEFADHKLFIFLICLILITLSLRLILEYNLILSVIYLSLFSLMTCLIYLLMDAPDVAMTEAAIGVVISTAFFLIILSKTHNNERTYSNNKLTASLSCIGLIYCLIVAGSSFYEYGDLNAQIHQHVVTKHYITDTGKEIGINSIVAAILASYRGFDTLGETLVIFTAGIIVMLILSYRNHHVK